MTPTLELEAEAPAAEVPAPMQHERAIFYRSEIEALMRFQRLCESMTVDQAWLLAHRRKFIEQSVPKIPYRRFRDFDSMALRSVRLPAGT